MAIANPYARKRIPEDDEMTALARMRAGAARAPVAGGLRGTDTSGIGKEGPAPALPPRPAPPPFGAGKDPRDFFGPGKGPDVGKGMGPGPGAGKSDDDGLDSLARTRAERERERKAAEEELRLGKQKAIQQTNARAGLAGFGLSGGTAALVSDVGRSQDRSATLAMADLGRRQRDEDFTAVQRMAALADIEDAYGQDFDDDGLANGKTPGEIDKEEADAQQTEDAKRAEEADAALYEQFPPGLRVEKDGDGNWRGYSKGSNYAFEMTDQQVEAYRKAERRRNPRR